MSIQIWKTLSRLVPPSYLSCPLEVCTCCLFLSLKKNSDALNKFDKINKSLYNPKVEIYVSENQSPEGVPISHQSPSSSRRGKRDVSRVKTDMTSQ